MESKNGTHSIPLGILDDLGSRFIINVPESQRRDIIRICFQLELAYWFYLDFYVAGLIDSAPKGLKACSMREFSDHMFRHIGFLKEYSGRVDTVLEEWKKYKFAVPTYGAIILNEDFSHILLVLGCWSKSWGFPKGKVNEDELPHVCAIREVMEETNFNIGPYLHKDEYLEMIIMDQVCRLYIIHGVSMDTKFKPRTRNEIRDTKWFPLVDLPANKKEQIKKNLGLNHSSFFKVTPFIKGLRKWISDYLKKQHEEKFQLSCSRPSQAKDSSLYTFQDIRESIDLNMSLSSKKVSRKSSDRNLKNTNESLGSIVGDNVVLKFCPKSWSNFHINKRKLRKAITSTPGWIT